MNSKSYAHLKREKAQKGRQTHYFFYFYCKLDFAFFLLQEELPLILTAYPSFIQLFLMQVIKLLCWEMGLYGDLGNVLTPEDTLAMQGLLKRIAAHQIVFILQKHQNLEENKSKAIVKWGNQIQGHFLKLDKNQGLDFCFQSIVQERLNAPFPLVPQWGSWMFQLVPKQAFDAQVNLQKILFGLKEKYQYFEKKGRMMITIPNIPFLGLTIEKKKIHNQVTKSDFIGDNYVTDHIRVKTMARNIMQRKGSKMSINVPLYIDEKTNLEEISKSQPNPNFIRMDSVAFGAGMSCLQCTFSTENLFNTQYIYDQMHIISPLMLALTAGTPFYKGKVSDWDVRWGVLEQGFDCRSNQQKNKQSSSYIPNSRYSASRTFIWPSSLNKERFNDLQVQINPQVKQIIKNKAQQKQLILQQKFINHLAGLISRDLLFVTESIAKSTGDSSDLFDMFNCQSYSSVRLKTPVDENIGWRAEFRTMDVQLTAEQNSAYSLLLYFFNLSMLQNQNLVNLYLPISLVAQNFTRAHLNNAAVRQKFYFRTNIFDNEEPVIEEMYLKQIFFGYEKQGKKFIGIFKFLFESLMNSKYKDKEELSDVLKDVVKFVEEKSTGKRVTLAQWMRNYANKHAEYKHDSVLSKSLIDDMLKTLYEISKGSLKDANFTQIFTYVSKK